MAALDQTKKGISIAQKKAMMDTTAAWKSLDETGCSLARNLKSFDFLLLFCFCWSLGILVILTPV